MAAVEEEAVDQVPAALCTATANLSVEDFIWSSDEWSTIRHDDFTNSDEVPIISLIGKDYDEVCRDMVNACEDWGFFRLVDHGIGTEIIKAMEEQCSRFFEMSMEEKMKGARSKEMPLGYINSASNPDYSENLPWSESIQLLQSPQLVIEFARKVFAERHQPLSDAFVKYMEELQELGNTIMKMLANGLGLSEDYFVQNFVEEKESTMIRVNQYPPCPLPDKCLGLGSHSDPHTLTILLQDEVGGLQVPKDDGEWIGIRPVPASFVVNVGDTLDAWTNGRLKSVVHRAVVNKEKKRVSIAYFMCPASQTLVECPTKLLERRANETRKYESFTWGEFRRELLLQKRVVRKTALDRYLLRTP